MSDWYIAGPMRGLPHFNFPAFDECAAWLRKRGWSVSNPAEHDREVYPGMAVWAGYPAGDIDRCPDFSFAAAMSWDIAEVASAKQGIVLLPGWSRSTGAREEKRVAELCGKRVFYYKSDDPDGIFRLHHEPLSDDQEFTIADTWRLILDAREDARESEHRAVDPAELRRIAAQTARLAAAADTGQETRVVDPETGGAKGQKLARTDLLPQDALLAVAEHYGLGARKYEARNWERGYAWSLSYAALLRHLLLWWGGEDDDPEFRASHLRAVAFHALSLLTFTIRQIGTDDRPQAASCQ